MKTLAAWRAAKQSFDWRGREIAYWTGGEGPPLMLIHGFPTASYDWHAVWPALTQRFRVFAPDMLGFGFSAKPRDTEFLLTDQADIHEELAARLGVSATHVLAHDYGVTVAQELLARQREGGQALTLQSVVFLNGGLFPELHRATPGQQMLLSPQGEAVAAMQTRETFGAALGPVFGPQTQPSAAEVDDLWALLAEGDGYKLMHKLISYVPQRRENRECWVGAVEAALVPQRFINGVLDPVSGGHAADHYEKVVPNADVVRLDVGHWPQLEAPEQVLAAFLEFHDRL